MEIARHWRLKEQRLNLIGTSCSDCGDKQFAPRRICPACRSTNLEKFKFSGRGRIYSYTLLHEAPRGYAEYLPYLVGLIQLEEGPLVMAQLTDMDSSEIAIGLPVEAVIRKIKETQAKKGLIVYGYKFRPLIKQEAAV